MRGEETNFQTNLPGNRSAGDGDERVMGIYLRLLEKDGLKVDDFLLPSMPELRLDSSSRKVKIFPKGIGLGEACSDDLNEGKLKVKVSFELGKGEYATNVVKQLFQI